MRRTALKVGAPIAVVVVIAVVVIVAMASGGGGGRKQPPSAKWSGDETRAVSRRQIQALPPASEVVQVTNLLGKPERVEEPGLASENPQRVYLYYPVKGAESSQRWEVAFEREGRLRLAGTDRCAAAVILERGGGACSRPPRR